MSPEERIVELESQVSAMKSALMIAWDDIRQWRQLARYQCEKMNNNLGWCPSQAGIERSGVVMRIIGDAIPGNNKKL